MTTSDRAASWSVVGSDWRRASVNDANADDGYESDRGGISVGVVVVVGGPSAVGCCCCCCWSWAEADLGENETDGRAPGGSALGLTNGRGWAGRARGDASGLPARECLRESRLPPGDAVGLLCVSRLTDHCEGASKGEARRVSPPARCTHVRERERARDTGKRGGGGTHLDRGLAKAVEALDGLAQLLVLVDVDEQLGAVGRD